MSAPPGKLRLVPEVEEVFSALPEPATPTERARRDGERGICNRYYASLVKRAKQETRDEILREAGVSTIADLSMLNAMKAELDTRWQREEAKAIKGGFWRGMSVGAAMGAAFAALLSMLVVGEAMQTAFDRAQEIAAASTLVGAATQRQNYEPVTTEPEGVDRNPVTGRRLTPPGS